jgi:large subunit ribosomal protein L15e
MGAFMYINELWKKKSSDVMHFVQRLRSWEYRHQHTITRCTKPTRPEKARMLGYKKKHGFSVFRVRVRRGNRKAPCHRGISAGKPKTAGVVGLKLQKNYKAVAEQRLGKKFGNLRVLNSYWVNNDSTFTWFEVICVDPMHQTIRNDPRVNWIVNAVHKHREQRSLTSAGRKHRGLMNKGHRASGIRPSVRAQWRRNNKMTFLRKR